MLKPHLHTCTVKKGSFKVTTRITTTINNVSVSEQSIRRAICKVICDFIESSEGHQGNISRPDRWLNFLFNVT